MSDFRILFVVVCRRGRQIQEFNKYKKLSEAQLIASKLIDCGLVADVAQRTEFACNPKPKEWHRRTHAATKGA